MDLSGLPQFTVVEIQSDDDCVTTPLTYVRQRRTLMMC